MAFKTPAPKAEWHKYAQTYDPIAIGSKDGTDTEPHDRAITRALNSSYQQPPTTIAQGKPRRTLFVGRLHPDTTELELRHEFRRCGRIRSCRLVCDLVTGTPKGYAFLVLDSSREAREAVRQMHGAHIRDRRILVQPECERTLAGWRPRRLGGGFGGYKESGQLRFGCVERPFQRPQVAVRGGRSLGNRPERELEETERMAGDSERSEL